MNPPSHIEERRLRQIIQENPRDSSAFYRLALLLEDHHSYEDALATLKKALAIDPAFNKAFTRSVMLLHTTSGKRRGKWIFTTPSGAEHPGKMPVLPDECRFRMYEKGSEVLLVPFMQRFGKAAQFLDEGREEEWKARHLPESFREKAILTFRKAPPPGISLDASSLTVELGTDFRDLFRDISLRAVHLTERFRKEKGIALAPPAFRVTRSLPADRFRVISGPYLLGQGGIKKDHLLAAREHQSAPPSLVPGVDTSIDALGLKGRWIGREGKKQAESEGFHVFEAIPLILETAYRLMEDHLDLLWSESHTGRFMEFLSKERPRTPWKTLETTLSLAALTGLIRHALRAGAAPAELPYCLEHLIESAHDDEYSMACLLWNRTVDLEGIRMLAQKGAFQALSIAPQLEENLLIFLGTHGDESVGDKLFPFSTVLDQLRDLSSKILQLGKRPMLICDSFLRPFISECMRIFPELLILSKEEASIIPPQQIFYEINEHPLALRAAAHQHVESALSFYPAPSGNNPFQDRDRISFASFFKEEERLLVDIEAAMIERCEAMSTVLIYYQEMGYRYEGLLSASVTGSEGGVHEPAEFVQSSPFSVELGRAYAPLLANKEELKRHVEGMRSLFSEKYSVILPEIHFHVDPAMEESTISLLFRGKPLFYSTMQDNPALTHILGGEKIVEDPIEAFMASLALVMENHLADFIDYEITADFLESLKGACEGGAEAPVERVAPVLRSLFEEKVPCRKKDFIAAEIESLSRKGASCGEIVESIREGLKEELLEPFLSEEKRLPAVPLGDDMEIILKSPLFEYLFDGQDASCMKERDYIAELIAKEYEATPGSRRKLPIMCTKSLRKPLFHLLKPWLPGVVILSRDEAAGSEIQPAGVIEASEGFRKFIFDEILKQGILSDHSHLEKELARKLTELLEHQEKEHGEEEKAERERDFITITMNPVFFESLGGERDKTGFSSTILFLREWLGKVTGRKVPQVLVALDDEALPEQAELSPGTGRTLRITIPRGCALSFSRGIQGFAGSSVPPAPPCLQGCWHEEKIPREQNDRIQVSALEYILLALFTLLKNRLCQAPLAAGQKKNLQRRAAECGLMEDDSEAVLHMAATAADIHPAQVCGALSPGMALVLGDRGLKERILELLSPVREASLNAEGGILHAVVAEDDLAAFLRGYMREASPQEIERFRPPSLKKVAGAFAASLLRLLRTGRRAVAVVPFELEPMLQGLLASIVPQAIVLPREFISAKTLIEPFETVPYKILFAPLEDEEETGPETFTIALDEFYLFLALLADEKGDTEKSGHFCEAVTGFFPLHPLALWRNAFSLQRRGNRDEAAKTREMALRALPELPFIDPAYYMPESARWESEKAFLEASMREAPLPVHQYRHLYCTFMEGAAGDSLSIPHELFDSLPFDDELLVLAGNIAGDREDYRDALAWYRKALALNGSNREALRGCAGALAEDSEFEKSWKIYRTLAGESPFDDRMLYDSAMVHMDREDYHSALACAETILAMDSENADAFFLRGRCWGSLGKTSREIADLTSALVLEPDNILFNRTMGELLWQSGLYQEAEPYLLSAFRVYRESPFAAIHRIKILLMLGDISSAMKLTDEAAEQSGSPPSALLHLQGEISALLGFREKAGECFKKAHGINRTNPVYAMSVAEMACLDGRLDEAAQIYREALQRNPYWVKASHALALIASRKGDVEGARKQLRSAMSYSPGTPELYASYFSLPPAEGEHGMWAELQRELIFLDPLNYGAYYCLSLLYALQGDFDRALGEAERAFLIAPDHHAIVEQLCRMHMVKRDGKRALVILRVALKKITRSERLCFIEGMCWKSIGSLERARESFLSASRHGPLTPFAAVSRGYAALIGGKAIEAAAEAEGALLGDSRFSPAMVLMAEIKHSSGEGDEAESLLAKALKSDPVRSWGLF
ncbi:MAG: FHIPEP family type III secretion protein [Candidatus Eremiobacteraeota bacterium]|nr:FHIPEP family type III secretion protein [Candidatus Eremiobacteraeota bacterium]